MGKQEEIGVSVFRILVPSHKVPGWAIESIFKDSKASVKLLPVGIAIISAKNDPKAHTPPAFDGLLRVHKLIMDGPNGGGQLIQPASAVRSTVTRLLVPDSQAFSLIRKKREVIKSMEKASGCVILVLDKDSLPPGALDDDSVVEIQGEPENVHNAVKFIANHLKQFLVDCSVLPLFEKPMTRKRKQVGHLSSPRKDHLIPLPHRLWKAPLIIKTLTLKPVPFRMTPAVVQSRIENLALIEGILPGADFYGQEVIHLEFYNRKTAESIKHHFDQIEPNVFTFWWSNFNIKDLPTPHRVDISYCESMRDEARPREWNPYSWINPLVPWQSGLYPKLWHAGLG